MPKLLIENLSTQPRQVGIEPWADVEVLPPDGRFEIEYDEPADLALAFMDQSIASISIVSERVVVVGAQETRTYTYKGS